MTTGAGALAQLIHPLDAYLPRPELAERVVAPAYDTLTIEETHRITAGNPLSFLNVVRSEIDFPEQTEAERRQMLTDTAARLRLLLGGDIFNYYEGPAYFVCRLELGGHSQVGIVADVSLDAYDRGLVKVHESTRRGQEDRLVTYMKLVRASFLPVFLVHRPAPEVDAVVAGVVSQAPMIDMAADANLRISMWAVTTPGDVAEVQQALGALDSLYVADGHHRAAAASRFVADMGNGASDRLTSVLFPADQLVVHAYNRCVADLGGLLPEELAARVGDGFAITPSTGDPAPRRSGEIAMHLDGSWYRIEVGEAYANARGVAGLDVTALHGGILEPMLGIGDVRSDPRIEFVPGTLGLGELERMCAGGFAAAFALHPMAVEDLLEVADRGELMPPKSTWFAPKLRSGLVVRLL